MFGLRSPQDTGRSDLAIRRLKAVRHPVRREQAADAYARSRLWGERRSRFAQEPVEVPAYEDSALSGNRAPHRFRWRGVWYSVADVSALWKDSRRPTADRPAMGRSYYNITESEGRHFQLYYELPLNKKERGHWVLYRQSEQVMGR
jgi:hypothetical protein